MKRLLVVLLLVSGCSLPLPSDVKSVDGVEAEGQQSGELLQVIPPGPRPGQTPEEAVLGFLGAQANSGDRHAIARSFLTDGQARSWDDVAEVQVYDLGSQRISRSGAAEPPTDTPADEAAVTVTATVTGQIREDGSYSERTGSVTETYRLERVKNEWRLSDVPPGLRLTAPDRERSFRASNVYYVAQTAPDTPPHLVPDRVFLPVGADQAKGLVARVLTAPSTWLRGSVEFRGGLRAGRVSTSGSGVVTVDLVAPARPLSTQDGQNLSAQLVWTLRELGPGFTGLRLLAGGKRLDVAGQGDVQDDGSWADYDPEGLGANPPYYFVTARRLRSSEELPPSAATAGGAGAPGAIGVEAVAVTPDRKQIALLDGHAPGQVVVRTGPLTGPTYRTAVTARDLRSPSWGSGDRGLWLLQDRREIVLLPTGGRALQRIPVVGRRPGGAFTALAVSRDGARVALVAGERLYVGRVELVGGRPRVAGLTLLGADLRATQVAWASSTGLAVLGLRDGQVQVLRVAADGSSVDILNSGGLVPTHIAATSSRLLLSAGGVLYSLTGRAPVRLASGTSPAYPG